MKAQAVYIVRPAEVEVREVDVPDPEPREVQVRTLANGICMLEVSFFTGAENRGEPFMAGHEGIGVVTKVGTDVDDLAEGDVVNCFKWATVQNAVAGRLHRFEPEPEDPAHYLAEPVVCALIGLRSYDLTPGDRVLVLGAGFMGLLNVQALVQSMISELVVTDLKARNLRLAKRFGATEVVQAGAEEGEAQLQELEEEPFDLVVEASGAEAPLQRAGSLVRRGGRLGIFGWHHEPRSVDFGEWHMRGLTVVNCSPVIETDRKTDYFARAVRSLNDGRFDMSDLITHRHPYGDAQRAMELAAERPEDYIKGVLTFDGTG
ncbi:MAG: zinc-dependent alcohol dehydrogenase [Planctomycetota bacterium]